jgi:membrane protease YdiL (CAAX protease family)
MFGAVFGIGLVVKVLFHRPGNLLIGAIFHGIGNAYIVSSIKT